MSPISIWQNFIGIESAYMNPTGVRLQGIFGVNERWDGDAFMAKITAQLHDLKDLGYTQILNRTCPNPPTWEGRNYNLLEFQNSQKPTNIPTPLLKNMKRKTAIELMMGSRSKIDFTSSEFYCHCLT